MNEKRELGRYSWHETLTGCGVTFRRHRQLRECQNRALAPEPEGSHLDQDPHEFRLVGSRHRLPGHGARQGRRRRSSRCDRSKKSESDQLFQAFWYTQSKGAYDGEVFGSSDKWVGLGLFFDSFDNDGKHNNPYIMAVLNDGTKQFAHQL
jgi:hypothetical protein